MRYRSHAREPSRLARFGARRRRCCRIGNLRQNPLVPSATTRRRNHDPAHHHARRRSQRVLSRLAARGRAAGAEAAAWRDPGARARGEPQLPRPRRAGAGLHADPEAALRAGVGRVRRGRRGRRGRDALQDRRPRRADLYAGLARRHADPGAAHAAHARRPAAGRAAGLHRRAGRGRGRRHRRISRTRKPRPCRSPP